jgi:hypothetical protein
MMRFDAVVQAWVEMVETIRIRQVVWLVMLESAKERILGVDTPGQQVTPHVQYVTPCLQIRDTMGRVPCSSEWEMA